MSRVIQVQPVNSDSISNMYEEDKKRRTEEGHLNQAQNVPVSQDESYVKYYQVFRPLFLSMKLVGLHFSLEDRPGRLTGQIYCTTVTTILGLNILRFLSSFNSSDGFHPATLNKLLVLIWMIKCFFSAYVCVKAVNGEQNLLTFFKKLACLQDGKDKPLDRGKVHKFVLIYTLVGWSVIVINMALSAYAIFATELFNATFAPFPLDAPYLVVIKAIVVIIHFYANCAWALSIVLSFSIACTTKREFYFCNRMFEKLTDIKDTKLFEEGFEHCYKCHQRVCSLLKNADNMLSFHNAVLLVSFVINQCLIIYNMVSYPLILEDTIVLALNILWMVSGFVIAGATAYGGGLVNHEVS